MHNTNKAHFKILCVKFVRFSLLCKQKNYVHDVSGAQLIIKHALKKFERSFEKNLKKKLENSNFKSEKFDQKVKFLKENTKKASKVSIKPSY